MIILLYGFFAIVATGINLVVQWPFFQYFHAPWVLFVALIAGTIAGLATKYILDKHWIFYYETKSKVDNARCFLLYMMMGVFTTFIFWGMETLFYFFFSFSGSQYVGGALGLTIGYTSKYFLDKKFVFRKSK